MNKITDAILSGHHNELHLPISASLVDQYRRELQRRPETLPLQLTRIDSLIDCLPANAGVCANAVELLLQIQFQMHADDPDTKERIAAALERGITSLNANLPMRAQQVVAFVVERAAESLDNVDFLRRLAASPFVHNVAKMYKPYYFSQPAGARCPPDVRAALDELLK